ncbi:MAG: hypothetical protein Tsb009_34200 [Planctomycetaceae bacterium]
MTKLENACDASPAVQLYRFLQANLTNLDSTMNLKTITASMIMVPTITVLPLPLHEDEVVLDTTREQIPVRPDPVAVPAENDLPNVGRKSRDRKQVLSSAARWEE